MLPSLPSYQYFIFIGTAFFTLYFFWRILKTSSNDIVQSKANFFITILLIWLVFQGILSYQLVFVKGITVFPPNFFFLGVLPTLLAIVFVFNSESGKIFINSLDLKQLTMLSVVRIPVEISLFWLFLAKKIPAVMTFEGLNFDILAGITALILVLFAFKNEKFNKSILIWWNIACLVLLINIIVLAVLSLPSPIQQLGFDQPNWAVLYFPFNWLPTVIVPLVLFTHLASLRKLLFKS